MTRAPAGLFSLLLAATLLSAEPSGPDRTGDWPMWGGRPDRNMFSDEKNVPAKWDAATGQNVKWSADLGDKTYGNPVIGGGRVYIGTSAADAKDRKDDRGVLMCFAEADGKFLWKAVHEKLTEDEDFSFIGICSTPCVAGDRVYYVSNRGELVCRAAADGKVVWLLDMRKELGVAPNQASSSSPLVVGNLVFTVTGHGTDAKLHKVKNPKAPSFIAVHRETGKVVWQDNSPGDRILTGQWGSPAYGVVDGKPQVAFPGGDGWLYAFEPETGKLIWKFNCRINEKTNTSGEPETENQLVATPAYADFRIFVALGQAPDNGHDSDPGCLWAIDARQKGDVTKTAELWKIDGRELNARKDPLITNSISTVAVHNGLVYSTEVRGLVTCTDVATGKRIWDHDSLSGMWGSPMVADGKVYLRDVDGETLIFQEGREKNLLATIKSAPDLHFEHGTVTIANGVMYLAARSKLYAIAAGK